ncbi:hypothetical protein NQ314_009938 [Rhamnusium bicolor]|uniref:UGGT thioredoxin-like domain-containing protein n=1 Tax=Rhamnusium bicolor TaxID=1586634 RepID=A0AAV8XW20_9CUCU|nr:hypothetical protein NQ314_009938 [Rhamnusium bicolor]
MDLFLLENDKERYNKIIDHASKLITPSQLSILRLGLSLHIYSPKVQMFEQIAQERNLPSCPTVADVGGKLTCDVEEAKQIINDVSRLFKEFFFCVIYKNEMNKLGTLY